MSHAQVSIIILNYHGIQDTRACLRSLGKQSTVVVNISDTGEKSTEGEELHKEFPYIDCLESGNVGFSGANNLGADYALTHHNTQYLLFLNNDTRVHASMLEHLIHASQENHDKLAVYSPKIYFETGYEYHHNAYTERERGKVLWYAGGFEDVKDVYGWHRGVDEVDMGQFDEQISIQFATGCALFMTKETYKKVGHWDKKYFLYFEDMDYSRRVRKKGGKVIYVPSAVMWHKNARSGGGSGSNLQQYYQTRNRLYYGFKYGSLNTKTFLVKHMFHEYKKTDQNTRKAFLDAVFGKMGKR